MSEEPTKLETYSLLDNCKKGTQKYILAEIFTEKKGEWITKREVEKQLVLRWSLRDIDDEIKFTKNYMISRATYVPGDIQRDLRLFYNTFKKYGLIKIEKDKLLNIELSYKWNPITIDKIEDIIHPEARNILKTKDDINRFLKTKNYKCEICGACKSDNETLRLAVDHWRAHSNYNIDDPKIAVLLCEKCNNIHHNFDASKIALKYKNNILIIKNWIKKENEIRNNGYMPNEDDIKTQRQNIQSITDYYKTLHPLPDNFWEGLF